MKSDGGNREQDDFLYLDGAHLDGYRNGDWKVKLPFKGFAGASWKNAVPAHDTLLFNLKEDPGEKHNLFETRKEFAKDLLEEMDSVYVGMGELPPSLIVNTPTDDSHYKMIGK